MAVVDWISQLEKIKVLVVGDVMLDRYWFGDTHRISPEAPVPVAKIERVEHRVGGAGNVARNIASLGAKATLLSVIGQDEAGVELQKLMTQSEVNTCLLTDPSISTTIKLRVIARNQQLIRLDFEANPQHEVLQEAMLEYAKRLPEADIVILSDYGKGGLAHVSAMIEQARVLGKPILVDPKGSDYNRYAHASIITPNRLELQAVIGSWADEAELHRKVTKLCQDIDVKSILLTRSEEGLSLFHQDGTVTHCPTSAREVFDVSGAGDTVIATMALAIVLGLDDFDAMYMANVTAGVVVAKLGTAVCTQQELLTHIEN